MSWIVNRSKDSLLRQVIRRASLVAAVAILAGAPNAAGQGGGRELEVRESVSAFASAYVAADVEALGALLSDDYIHVNGGTGGVLDRQGWLRWIAQRREDLEAGRLVIDEYEVEGVQVRFHGDTAVVVGSVVSRERRNGEPFESRLRFTNVWVHGEGGWRRVAFHDSPLR